MNSLSELKLSTRSNEKFIFRCLDSHKLEIILILGSNYLFLLGFNSYIGAGELCLGDQFRNKRSNPKALFLLSVVIKVDADDLSFLVGNNITKNLVMQLDST